METNNPYQYGYNQPVQQTNGSKGLAITSLVLGIITLIGSAFVIGTLPFALAAIITGVIAITKNKAGKGMAIAGVITAIIGAVISCILIAVTIPYISLGMEIVQNAPEIVENYQENGEIPETLEELDEQYPGFAEAFMEEFIVEYEKNPEAFSSLSEME